jgi:hypothetical protein
MNSKNDIPIHLPTYDLGLIPSKIANTVMVSHPIGSNHNFNINVAVIFGMVNMKSKFYIILL